MSYDLGTDAVKLLGVLTSGVSFNIPVVNLNDPRFQLPSNSDIYASIGRVSLDELTTRQVGGSGAFDAMMEAMRVHLREEFEADRITGDQYAKMYTELTAAAMSNATQFVLNREQTFWAAAVGQSQAISGAIQIEIEKIKAAQATYEANTVKANYGLTVAKIGTEELNFETIGYNLDNILPMQLKLVSEQAEAQHAQTMDMRLDGVTTITGTLGKQKELLEQQITSYKRDAEIKAAKIFSDAWITQKTIDEGLLAPAGFQNSSLDEILSTLKINLSLNGS